MTDARLLPPKDQIDLIAGNWERPSETLGHTIDDPNTGEFRQAQVATSAANVERALAAAAGLHRTGAFARSSVESRIELLDRLADGLDARVRTIGYEDALANGNPLSVATAMAGFLGARVRSAGSQLRAIGETTDLAPNPRPVQLLNQPLGPAAVIAPWNAPTFVAVAKVASALAAGCPVILKPSEWAPAGCQIVAEVLAEAIEELGLPSATFQLVHGAAAVGGQVVGDQRIRAISFTGGGAGGRAVAAAAAPHFTALQLELGGHNPAVVLADANVASTAASLVDGMTKLNGQWCEAPGKVLVNELIHDDLVDAILTELSKVRVNHCLAEGTDVGPLSHRSHRDHLLGRIDNLVQAGGSALSASELPPLAGWFMAPTMVVGTAAGDSTAELFGPAISVHKMASDEDAIGAADGPETGLAGFVFGTDIDRAMDAASRIPAGEVRVNGCKLADLADGSEQSFWNAAGIGGHGPTDMVRFFQGRKTIGLDDPSLPI